MTVIIRLLNPPPSGDALHNPIQIISLLYYEALACFKHPRTWFPLFLFWSVQAVLLTAVANFLFLPGGDFFAEWLRKWFGDSVVEYPRFYLWLPVLQRRLYLVLAGLLGVYLQGVVLLNLLSHHSRHRVGHDHPWRRSFRRWPGLFLINMFRMLMFFIPLYCVKLFLLPVMGPGSAARGVLLSVYGLGFLVETFMAYAALCYIYYDRNPVRAIKLSIIFVKDHFGVVLGLVLIPFFLALPLQGLIAMRYEIINNFKPELVFHLLQLTSFLTVVILFIQLSSMVRYYAQEELRRPFEGEWDDKHLLPEKRVYDPSGPGGY
jgi:hypothetical protein